MSIDESLFQMEDNLCMRYRGWTPIQVEQTSFDSIIDLYADIRRMQIRQDRKKNGPIRRRASDDAGWW